jgi:1-acyl-sn-glycerol-3-phosphate acyltransferase
MGSQKARDEALEKLTDKIKIKPHIFEKFSTPVYTFLRLILSQVFRSIFPANFTGLNNVPKKGPVIFASNHLSHVDPIFMIAGSRRKLHFLAKHEHFERFVTRFVVSSTGQIKTVREEGGRGALSTASGVLDSGRCMGIFPEGTRSRNSEPPFLGKGKTGIARLAASYPEVLIIPVVCEGTRNFMQPKKHKFPRFWRSVTIHFGKAITWKEWIYHEKGGNLNDKEIEKLANQDIEKQKEVLSELYRRFTDQFMMTLKHMGAV